MRMPQSVRTPLSPMRLPVWPRGYVGTTVARKAALGGFRLGGRFVPILGWVLLAADVYLLLRHYWPAVLPGWNLLNCPGLNPVYLNCPPTFASRFAQEGCSSLACATERWVNKDSASFGPHGPTVAFVRAYEYRRVVADPTYGYISGRVYQRSPANVQPLPRFPLPVFPQPVPIAPGAPLPHLPSPTEIPGMPVPGAPPVPMVPPSIDPFTPPLMPQPEPAPVPYRLIPRRINNPWRSPSEQPQRGPIRMPSPSPAPVPPNPGQPPRDKPEKEKPPKKPPREKPRDRPRVPPWRDPEDNPFIPRIWRDFPYRQQAPRREFQVGRRVRPWQSRNPADRRPPPKGTKERKLKSPVYYRAIMSIFDLVTETMDVVNALYWAIPPNLRKKGYTSPVDKARAVYRHFGEIDLDTAIKNLMRNQLEDMLIGMQSKVSQAAMRNFGFGAQAVDPIGRVSREFGAFDWVSALLDELH